MAEGADERTEQATDAKREEFRRQGQVAQTRELSGAALFLLASGGLYVMGRFCFNQVAELFNRSMGAEMVALLRGGNVFDLVQFAGVKALLIVLPLVLAAGVIGVASILIQTGFLQVEDALTPNFERMNPIEGLKRIFSLRGLMEGLKSILKLVAVGVILYLLLKSEARQVPHLVSFSLEQIFGYIGAVTAKLLFGIGAAMVVLAGADYFFQRWDLERKMMMSKQEVKEEIKQREGDPRVKQRIRQIQRQMANKRMMADIPKADVVITNPTHIAVVLKYSENLPAPQLVAKGADLVAEKIKEIARQHNIPIVENKPLARTIFKTLKIGQVIPRELFVAVAEVLAYVFRLRKKVRK